MSGSIDIVQLVKDLPLRPRGRACIVLSRDYQGQKKWATKLASQTNSKYLNLLELFARDKTLSSKLQQFLVPNLFDFLKGQCLTSVLIVSGLEFLKATWKGQPNVMEQFASYVETWDKNPCLLFVLQYDKTLATYEFRRFRQYTFVVDQKETLAL